MRDCACVCVLGVGAASQVWPWEMERLAGGVMQIPIFLSILQPGLVRALPVPCTHTARVPSVCSACVAAPGWRIRVSSRTRLQKR